MTALYQRGHGCAANRSGRSEHADAVVLGRDRLGWRWCCGRDFVALARARRLRGARSVGDWHYRKIARVGVVVERSPPGRRTSQSAAAKSICADQPSVRSARATGDHALPRPMQHSRAVSAGRAGLGSAEFIQLQPGCVLNSRLWLVTRTVGSEPVSVLFPAFREFAGKNDMLSVFKGKWLVI